MFDIVIKNAQVFDGSCNPWYYSDICIKKGRIEKTGKVFTGEKARSPYKPLSPPGRGKARGKKTGEEHSQLWQNVVKGEGG